MRIGVIISTSSLQSVNCVCVLKLHSCSAAFLTAVLFEHCGSAMESYTDAQRIEIVKIHYRNGESFAETVRKCRSFFGHHKAPSRRTVVRLIQKFETIGSVQTQKRDIRVREARSDENIAAVRESVNQNPSISIRHRSKQLNLSRSSLQRILTKDLNLFDRMAAIPGRALHYVFKIGDRAKSALFYRNILGMQVLRHEEFTDGCDAQCNGPYDNRWSKTMIGYGPESSHFVIELTYNYGVKSYEIGNDFGGITIKSKEVIERAKENNYPMISDEKFHILTAPDGYKFYVLNEPQPVDSDPVVKVTLHSTNIEKSRNYWQEILTMKVLEQDEKSVVLSYGTTQASLELKEISEPLNRAKAYGRIAFAVPLDVQPKIDEIIKACEGKILTPLITLDTPGKATVRVIILADPDGHEICFVDEEGFSQLSAVDPNGNELLDKYIGKDPFQEK